MFYWAEYVTSEGLLSAPFQSALKKKAFFYFHMILFKNYEHSNKVFFCTEMQVKVTICVAYLNYLWQPCQCDAVAKQTKKITQLRCSERGQICDESSSSTRKYMKERRHLASYSYVQSTTVFNKTRTFSHRSSKTNPNDIYLLLQLENPTLRRNSTKLLGSCMNCSQPSDETIIVSLNEVIIKTQINYVFFI